jgi:hypothetical protein
MFPVTEVSSSKRPNRVGVCLPLPEEANISRFRKVFSSYIEIRTIFKVLKASDRQNPLESSYDIDHIYKISIKYIIF